MSAYPHPQQVPPQGEGGGGMKCCMMSCLLIIVLSLLTCGAGSLWMWFYGKGFLADQFRNAFVAAINDSELSEEDKQEIIEQIDRVTDGFKSGEIGYDKLGKIFEELAQSPVMTVILVEAFDEKYIQPSKLDPQEKEEGRRVMERLARGVIDGTVSKEEAEEALRRVIVKKNEENVKELKDELSDQELHDTIADARRLVDAKGVPDEPLDVDVGAEFRKAVDKALGVAPQEEKPAETMPEENMPNQA